MNEFDQEVMLIDKLHAYNDRLESSSRELEKEHRLLLVSAAFEHDTVRKDAEIEQQKWIAAELQRRTEQAQREIEFTAAARAAAARAEAVEAEAARVEAASRAAQRAAHDEAQRRTARLHEIAEQERASRKPSNAPVIETPLPPPQVTEPKAANLPPTPPSKPVVDAQLKALSKPTNQTPLPFASNNKDPQALATHQKYLAVHRRLKELRQSVKFNLSDTQLKTKAGEYRREIKKSVGQLTTNMAANTMPYNKIRSILHEAASLQQPQIDIKPFLVVELPPALASMSATAGIVQTYLLNIFTKAVISQFVNEAGVSLKAAEPIGTVAIRIFAANEFKWQGVSMIDILIAKFHAVCPVLFGMYKIGPSAQKQKHGEGLTGLGAGFAALSLRDFGKSTIVNPFPPSNYWQAVARLVNTPSNEATEEHFIVLKGMIENHAGKFINFFGQAAVVALRKAVVEFPQRAPKSVASSALATLEASFKRDMHLTLRSG